MTRNPKPKDFRHEVRRRAYMAAPNLEDAATAIGVSRQTLHEWMAKGDLRISQLEALAKASKKPLALYFDADSKNEPAPIDWGRLSEWLSSINEMVMATEPDVPVADLVQSAASDDETKPEQGGGGASPDPKPPTQARRKSGAPNGQ